MSNDKIVISKEDLPSHLTEKPKRKYTRKPPTPEVNPRDLTIWFENDVLYVKHRIDSKIPKFTRMKSTVVDDVYKLSEYNVSGY